MLVALLLCVEAAPASACEPPPPTRLRDALPADGAIGVPINAQVRLDYDGVETTGLQDVEVRPVGGAALATTIALFGNAGYPLRHLVVVHLQTALAPQTQYEVRAGSTVVSTFRTGDGADTTPPSFAGITSVTTSVTDCASSACCGPNRIAYVHLGWGGVSDDFSVAMVRYNVYGAGGALVAPMTSAAAVGYQLCSGELTGAGPNGNFQGGSGGYRVRAVDLAGNEDPNDVTQDVMVSCAPQPDAGPDAGNGNGNGDSSSSPSGGCACTTAGGSPDALAIPMLLVLWCLISTKTRRRHEPGPIPSCTQSARPTGFKLVSIRHTGRPTVLEPAARILGSHERIGRPIEDVH